MADEPRILWYFADPMCSWCWGFSPVINAIRDRYRGQIEARIVMGGLRPGTTGPVTPDFRAEILHHWHDVQARTGQPFAFEGAMSEGFVYDTEPPARALIVVADRNAPETFPFLHSVQEAFYARQQDVTRREMLADLAEHHGVAHAEFLGRFDSDEARARTQQHFEFTRQIGVRGFPTVVLQHGERYVLLTSGYRSLDDLRPDIDAWLTGR